MIIIAVLLTIFGAAIGLTEPRGKIYQALGLGLLLLAAAFAGAAFND